MATKKKPALPAKLKLPKQTETQRLQTDLNYANHELGYQRAEANKWHELAVKQDEAINEGWKEIKKLRNQRENIFLYGMAAGLWFALLLVRMKKAQQNERYSYGR